MTKRILWIFGGMVVLAVLLFNPFSLIFLNVVLSLWQIRGIEAQLQKPRVYEPVARALAIYCQSDQTLFPRILGPSWLPKEVSDLGHPYCRVGSDRAMVQLGGGFYHFGYELKLEERPAAPAPPLDLMGRTGASPATNVWKLYLAREGSADKLLMTLSLAATQRLEAAEVEARVLANLDHSISQGAADAYKSKVMTQLRFGHPSAAAATCQDWIRARPNSWLPQFTYAHVRCRLGESQLAAAEFSDWINAHKDFAHCIYLALFDYREGRTNEAIQAVRLALDQPLVETSTADANIFYLAANGALIAYSAGDYTLCQSICDKMLATRLNDKWWLRGELRIKAATTLMLGNRAAALELMTQAENANEPDPFSHEPRARADRILRAAIEQNDIAAVRDFRAWADDFDRWYSPYETDETGFHGPNLGIPTPYPASWKSDRMRPDPPQ